MKKLNRTKKIILLSAIFFTLMALVAVFNDGGILAVSEFKQDLLNLEAENQKLKEDNSKIRKEVKALKSDPHAIEKVARENLNLAKPGEIIYQIVRKPRNQSPPHSNKPPG